MGKWSKLPLDLLYIIDDNIVLYNDKVRIRAVNPEWNLYLSKLPDHRTKQLPWLLHPLTDDISEASHGLYNPLENKVYKIDLPEARNKLFKGSSYGWIVTLEDMHSTTRTDICLINPVTRAKIKLPPRTEFADVVRYCPDDIDEEFVCRAFYDMRVSASIAKSFTDEEIFSWHETMLEKTDKIVLSASPCDIDECVAVAIYGVAYRLAWCRCNDKKWTHIYTRGLSGFIDILFSKNILYALDNEGLVVMFENIGTNVDIKFTKIGAKKEPIPRSKIAYLAESSHGNLMVVGREYYPDETDGWLSLQTMGFNVYKLNSQNLEWVKDNDIGDDVLFVGFGSARTIILSDFAGYKRNHIYFSDSTRHYDECSNSKPDVGTYNLEGETVEYLPGFDKHILNRPIWINFA